MTDTCLCATGVGVPESSTVRDSVAIVSGVMCADRCNHPVALVARHPGKAWQRKNLATRSVGDRKPGMTAARLGRLRVIGHRVVDLGADSLLGEVRSQGIPVVAPDHEQVGHVLALAPTC